jgi:hypothetical protein
VAFVPSGSEFRVNSQTGGDQIRPEIAALANGGFIVVWDDASGTLGDSSGRSIKAQLYSASGAAVGGEFLVNTQTTGDQVGPKVTGLSDGRFVVTWTDASGVSDGSLSSVQAQIFDAAGFRIGTEFVVNSQTSSSQSASDIAPWEGDRFVITWTDAVGDEVMARRYDASGTGFADFVVPDTTINIQDAARVAVLANGQFVITWEDTSGGSPFSQPADSSGYGIKAKNSGKFDFEFLVNTDTIGSQRFPDVAGLTNGDYVVAWQDENSTSGDIKARIIAPGGPAGTSEFLVNTQTTGTQADAKITALADGGFVITWSDFSAGAPNIKAQAFDAAGATIGTEFLVNTQTSLDQTTPAIVGLPNGGFVAVWADQSGTLGDGSGFSIKAQIYQLQPTTGTPGDDSFMALPGSNRFDGLGGIDTVTFNFRLVDATVRYSGNAVIIDGPSSHTVLTGFERYVFADGTVDNNDGNALVDDLFYYARNPDVWNAHVDADAHYDAFGWHEWRDPNAFFSTSLYLAVNADVKAAGVNPLAHFHESGWAEGRQPSAAFDVAAFLRANQDIAAAHIDPLAHFLQLGAGEGRQPIALTSLTTSNGFDYIYYLAHNPDVAAAHVDPFGHFQQFGWKEGRNPNALFDTRGYLATYTDVAAGGANPLDHYNQFGWREGRDPSVNFDTTSYLAAYPDIAAAQINPLVHYFQFGQAEGRQVFADGVWG